MPDLGDPMVEREVLMAAHEGSEQAEQAEQRGIGATTIEQFHADVTRLSSEYMTGEPLPLFREMRRVRNRMHAALDRRVWPRDTTDVYLLLGCTNALMAAVADDLGCPAAAEELYRTGWAYALVIDHRALMAKLRLGLSNLAHWNGQFRRAADFASDGLEYLSHGPTGVQLHLKYGRAAARLGDVNAARRAIAAASQARDQAYSDDLTSIAGEFDLSRASERYLVGSVLIELPSAVEETVAELQHATELYAAGPGPDETHGYGMEALARVNLAEAHLRAGGLESAADALDAVLTLPGSKRIDPIPQRLDRVRAELARPAYHGSAQARELDERIEEFSRESLAAVTELPGLPG
jgi:tetratricopeptide (TPR) repeat protein